MLVNKKPISTTRKSRKVPRNNVKAKANHQKTLSQLSPTTTSESLEMSPSVGQPVSPVTKMTHEDIAKGLTKNTAMELERAIATAQAEEAKSTPMQRQHFDAQNSKVQSLLDRSSEVLTANAATMHRTRLSIDTMERSMADIKDTQSKLQEFNHQTEIIFEQARAVFQKLEEEEKEEEEIASPCRVEALLRSPAKKYTGTLKVGEGFMLTN